MPVKFLGISVGKFEDNVEIKKTRKINDFFSAGASKESTDKSNKDNAKPNDVKVTKDKKKPDKEFIMQKFLQTTTKANSIENKITKAETKSPEINLNTALKERVIEHSLDRQESFFAKFLNKGQGESSKQEPSVIEKDEDKIRATTPICKVVECGDDSNDSDYSGSTINNEINKSIALFDEDPQDVARVSQMRTLLNTTKLEVNEPVAEKPEPKQKALPKPSSPNQIETFECPECRKLVPMTMVDTHSDYHVALKLRDEERQQMRKEREKSAPTPVPIKKLEVKEEPKIEANTSIASFFTKVDDNIPTEGCAECGKRISVDKFAEHLDFHEAQKLSRELNKKPVLNFSSNSVKRKRKSISPVKRTKMPCKTIDSFFRQ